MLFRCYLAVGGCPSFTGGLVHRDFLLVYKEVMPMNSYVSFSELILYTTMLIAFAKFIVDILNKKK